MSTIDHDEIYLQPRCCADEYVGRLWCEDADPEDCEDGNHWTRYVRADIHEAVVAEAEQLRERCKYLQQVVDGEFPEGCTPADARMLRVANHGLIAENEQLRARVAELEFALRECVMEWDGELPEERREGFIGRARKLLKSNQIEGGE